MQSVESDVEDERMDQIHSFIVNIDEDSEVEEEENRVSSDEICSFNISNKEKLDNRNFI